MWQRYMMLGVLVLLLLGWFFMPKVTEKDAQAFSEALFLEQCREKNLNPAQYQKPPKFSVEGGDQNLIFVFTYFSNNLPTMTIKIDKMGETTVGYEEGAHKKRMPKTTKASTE